MKKKDSLIMILGVLSVLSFCSLILVALPSFSPFLDFSSDETSNIGSTIGGITGPIVGMFSAYLLYQALTSQQEGNKDQRIKADSDIIFLLLNQLDKDYDAFDLKKTKGDEDIKLYGYYALADICYTFKEHRNEPEIYNAFESALTTNRTLYMIRSFMMIRERVFLSKFSQEVERMFIKKLEMYYESKFKYPIKHLVDAFGYLNHDLINEIKEFQNVNTLNLDL